MKIEYRALRNRPPLLKRGEGDARPRVEGYGAVFYDPADAGTQYQMWEDCFERIDPMCFNRALAEKHPARSFVNHNPDRINGRVDKGTLELRVDKMGLWYSAEIPDTSSGRDLIVDLERGNIDGSSFSFDATGRRYEEEKIGERWIVYRYLTDVTLHEVGPVAMPAYESTTAGNRTKNFEEAQAEVAAWRDSRRNLRDAEEVDVRMALMRCNGDSVISDMN